VVPAGSTGLGVDALAERGPLGGDALVHGVVEALAGFLSSRRGWRGQLLARGGDGRGGAGSPGSVLVDISEPVSGEAA
jgi:hypothetical protein